MNGADGIAVGMATSIPPHNLAEVIDGVIAYMKNNDITVKELMQYIKGPDFPTGGLVVNKDDLLSIYESGAGKIKLRGKVEVEKGKNGKNLLVITEIPYTMICLLYTSETNIDYLEDEQYGSFKNLIKTGDLFDAEFCYKTIPEELNPYDYKTFERCV